mgnify:CR=1 FL=1
MKNRLKVLRAERDWSQADLADRVGLVGIRQFTLGEPGAIAQAIAGDRRRFEFVLGLVVQVLVAALAQHQLAVGLGSGQIHLESIKLGLCDLCVLGLVGVQFSKRGLAGKGLQRRSQGPHGGSVGRNACGKGG